jgi:hypothetical protein
VHSIVPAAGAVLWLLACVALTKARPGGQLRRLVVLTAAVAGALLIATLATAFVHNTLYADVLTSISFLATLQCFAATMAEFAFDLHEGALERSWENTGRCLVVVDVAAVLVALAWAANVVERRQSGRFRLTAVGLAPVGTSGQVCLVLFALVLAVGAGAFLWSTWLTYAWSGAGDVKSPRATSDS